MPTSRKKPAARAKAIAPATKVAEEKNSASPRLAFPIAAIGASAGGLEAFSNLLRALPSDPGVALVFIPHLDPTHESAMVELLARTTSLPVRQVTDSMRVEMNTVYVLPPNCDMTISQGVLHLARRGNRAGVITCQLTPFSVRWPKTRHPMPSA